MGLPLPTPLLGFAGCGFDGQGLVLRLRCFRCARSLHWWGQRPGVCGATFRRKGGDGAADRMMWCGSQKRNRPRNLGGWRAVREALLPVRAKRFGGRGGGCGVSCIMGSYPVRDMASKGDKFRHPRYGRLGSSPAWPLSAITSRLPESGDITPRIMDDWGQQSCRVWLAKAPVVQDTNIVTGAESRYDPKGSGAACCGQQAGHAWW